MVTEPAVEGAVYAAWQVLAAEPDDERVQVVAEKEPPAPPSLHETVPEGEEVELPVSVTVAVNVSAPPTVTEAGLGETVVALGCEQLITAVSEVALVIDIALGLVVLPVSSQWPNEQDP